jgi:hypothetical protein
LLGYGSNPDWYKPINFRTNATYQAALPFVSKLVPNFNFFVFDMLLKLSFEMSVAGVTSTAHVCHCGVCMRTSLCVEQSICATKGRMLLLLVVATKCPNTSVMCAANFELWRAELVHVSVMN